MQPFACAPIETSVLDEGGDLVDFIGRFVVAPPERTVLAITTKLVSLSEKRTVARGRINKIDLIRREAERVLGDMTHGAVLTITRGLMIASAGIDESNSARGDYILYPEDPARSARALWAQLRARWGLNEFGVLLTDSRTSPRRRGVTGVALAYYGFRGVKSLVGTEDLYGRPLKMTQVNIADSLAAAAVLVMGEAAECRPLARITYPELEFFDGTDSDRLMVRGEEDLYAPFFNLSDAADGLRDG